MDNNFDKLFEALHLPKELIDAYSGETIAENAETLVDDFNKSKTDFFKASPDFKAALKTERDKTFAGTNRNVMKSLNDEFGLELTNSQIDEIKDFKDFTAQLKTHIDTQSKKSGESEELTKYKDQVSTLRKEKSALTDQLELAKAEQEAKINEATNQLKAENYWASMITKDTELGALDIPGKAFALDAIKKEIFNTVKIDGEGNIVNKDDTAFMHPSGKKVVSKLDELFAHYKETAGLIKRSNAGGGGGGTVSDPAQVDEVSAAKILENIRAGRT